MDFVGDLSVIEPANVLQLCGLSSLSGELRLITLVNSASFYFRDGQLIYAWIESRKRRIGQFLIEKGLITQEQLRDALLAFRDNQGKKRVGEILIEQGYLSRKALVAAIQEQFRESVYQVLSWKRGHFIFSKNVYPEYEDILLDDRMEHLLLEGLRRLDENR